MTPLCPGCANGDQAAGHESPHLGPQEQSQAAAHAMVIYELVREEGEAELRRRKDALFWSGLATGLSMGFSKFTLALIRSGLPDAPWRRLIEGLGYYFGFASHSGAPAAFHREHSNNCATFDRQAGLATFFGLAADVGP
jgi:hypothetical protein